MSAPDFIEPLIGYRTWWINGEEMLASPHRSESWIPGARPHCTFQSEQHLPPVCECQCGWHVYKDVYPALLLARPDYVVGKVHIWGRVEEHGDGYRSEYAKPVLLASLGLVPEEVVQALAARYDAETTQLEAFCAQAVR